jgi:hypothetical protein
LRAARRAETSRKRNTRTSRELTRAQQEAPPKWAGLLDFSEERAARTRRESAYLLFEPKMLQPVEAAGAAAAFLDDFFFEAFFFFGAAFLAAAFLTAFFAVFFFAVFWATFFTAF